MSINFSIGNIAKFKRCSMRSLFVLFVTKQENKKTRDSDEGHEHDEIKDNTIAMYF